MPGRTIAAAQYDLAIVGGGMVGASLALALGRSARRVAVIEPVLPGAGSQPSFDDRTSALSNGTRRVLETIGAWGGIAAEAAAIGEIQVSDAGRFGATRLDAAAQGLPALGYTVSNRAIGSALWHALRHCPGVAIIAPARVSAVQYGDTSVQLTLADGSMLQTQLAVAADGAQSLMRQSAGIEAEFVDYRQVAIVANLQASVPAQGIAYERFTTHGPIALLPRHNGDYTIVWTVATADAAQALALDDAAFCQALQARFGWRVGAFTRVGARASYALSLCRAVRVTAPRLAVIGNAAQALHPVAGQGFNLGLRDAAVLAELVAAAAGDAGDPAVLAEYARRRAADRAGMIQFTDGLVRLFALEAPGAATLRNLGMLLFDGSPGLKQALSRVSWGFGGRAPQLLRGLPLRPGRT